MKTAIVAHHCDVTPDDARRQLYDAGGHLRRALEAHASHAVRLHDEWISFYRAEQLESPRIRRAERRHIAGINYRPYPQIAIKGEFYRSLPLERDFLHDDGGEEAKPFNGFATAAVFFF